MSGKFDDGYRAGPGGKLHTRAIAAVSVAVMVLAGCSSLPPLRDPTRDAGVPQTESGANAAYPHLGDVPARPEVTESEADRREITDRLISDRDNVRYSDELLRGGQEPLATPPPPPIGGTNQPAAPADEPTGATPEPEKRSEKASKPGFFARLFGGTKAASEAGIPPLPARPTAPVAVGPAEPIKEMD